MAISFITFDSTNLDTPVVAPPSQRSFTYPSIKVNDLLIFFWASDENYPSGPIISVTDTSGDTWIKAGVDNGPPRMECWYMYATSGAIAQVSNFTINYPNHGMFGYNMQQFRGVKIIEQVNSTRGNSASYSLSTGLRDTNGWVVGSVAISNPTATTSVNSGVTFIQDTPAVDTAHGGKGLWITTMYTQPAAPAASASVGCSFGIAPANFCAMNVALEIVPLDNQGGRQVRGLGLIQGAFGGTVTRI